MDKKYLVPVTILTAMVMSATLAAADTNVMGLDPDKIKSRLPATFEEAEAEIAPVRNRFLMWTNDGTHIMWGTYGRGYFVGTDNNGNRAWGMYHKGIFAGFYDGEFFLGKYGRGQWKALNLFGERYTSGRYVTFPSLMPVQAEFLEA